MYQNVARSTTDQIESGTLDRDGSTRYTTKKILSNMLYNVMNLGTSRILSFVAVTLIIRALGPKDFGDYAFGLALIGYAGIFVNFGLSTYGSKNINQVSDPDQIADIVSQIVSLRLLLSIITYFPLVLVYIFTSIDYILLLIILNTKSFADALNFEWYFKGVLKNKYVLISTLLCNVVHLTAVVIFYRQYNLFIACISVSASYVALSFCQLYMITKCERIAIKVQSLNLEEIRSIASCTWPFFFTGIFSMILFNTDTIFLKLYTNSEIVGYYNCAHRLIDVLSNLRFAIIGVLFPVFSEAYFRRPNRLLTNFFSAFRIAFSGILAITIFIHIYAHEIILFLFGMEFYNSIMILKYLIYTSLLLYINVFLSALYNAIGYEKKVFYSIMIAAIVNIGLNRLLIVEYKAAGAIVATIFALILSTALLILQFPKAVRKIDTQRLSII